MAEPFHLTALRLRLGIPHPSRAEDTTCVCGHPDTLEPLHPLTCPLSRSQDHAQSAILQELYAMANMAAYTTTRNYQGLLQQRTGPVAIARAGRVTGLQATICDPASATNLQAALERKGAVAYRAELSLLTASQLLRTQDQHVPVAFEAYGLMGEQVDGLLKTLADDIAARTPAGHTTKSQLLQFLRHRLSITAMTAVSRAVLSKPDATFANEPDLPPFPSIFDPNCGFDISDLPEEEAL